MPVGSTTNATWTGSSNSNWNSNANWTPGGPPTATATFPAVGNEAINFPSSTTTIGQEIFTAPGYTENITSGNSNLVFTGQGILTGAGPLSDPNNRPIVNIAGAGDTVTFLNSSTGGLARFIIGSGGTLDLSMHAVPSGMTAGSVVNAGLIDIGNPNGITVGNSLTVFGPYVGMGGTIHLNTFLASDGSPSDLLILDGSQPTIDGPATGNTFLRITNAGGPGAQTTDNGILVVNAINGSTTAPGAFALSSEVRAGAFDYFLFRGGIDGVSVPDDWFLRSTFIAPTVPPSTQPIGVPPIPPSTLPITVPPLALPGGELPPDPPPAVLPPGLWPIIGPELATYGVVQPTARELGLATLGTLNQRIGDTMTLANAGPDTNGWARSEWGRFFGQQVDDHYQAFADPRTSGWLGGFQGGLDLWRGELLPGRDATGVYFAYGHADMNVSGLVTNPQATGYMLTHTGSVGMDAFSTGTYWTHYAPSGWYFDAVLQGSVYTTSATTQFAALKTDGYGFVSSLEAGYPIALPFFGPHFVLEPQAQIIWQQIGFGASNDGVGQIALGTTSGFTGRLGVRGQWTMQGYGATVWQPYVGVNFWRDWDAAATTTFGADPVPLLEQATRTETFAGVTAKLGDHLSAYAQGGYQFAMQQTFYGIRRDGVQGDVGMRYSW